MRHLPFRYRALDPNRDSVRLLILQPGQPADAVQCRLRIAYLSERPEYDALSYTWGDEHNLMPLVLDGRTVSIRRNLWTFQGNLRHTQTQQMVWADAVCINQSDLKEKSHQVNMMDRIFRSARTVRAWLGEERDDSAALFDFLADVQRRVGNTYDTETLFKHYKFATMVDTWQALLKFSERPYWHRTWIMQELLLAQNITIHCGEQTIPWETFRIAHLCLLRASDYYHTAREVHDEIEIRGRVTTLSKLTKLWTSSLCSEIMFLQSSRSVDGFPLSGLFEYSLFEYIKKFRYTQCLDPRDMVYALQSLSDDVPVTADYTISRGTLLYNICRSRSGTFVAWEFEVLRIVLQLSWQGITEAFMDAPRLQVPSSVPSHPSIRVRLLEFEKVRTVLPMASSRRPSDTTASSAFFLESQKDSLVLFGNSPPKYEIDGYPGRWMTTCQVRIGDRLMELANTDAYLILDKKNGQWLPKGTSLVYQGHPGMKNPDRAHLLQKVILSEIMPDIHYTPTDLPSGSCEPGTAISKDSCELGPFAMQCVCACYRQRDDDGLERRTFGTTV